MAGSARSGTVAWLPRRPEDRPPEGRSLGPEHKPRGLDGPVTGAATRSTARFGDDPMQPAPGSPEHGPRGRGAGRRQTRPFRFGSEDRPEGEGILQPGEAIGDRYRVLRLLGEGGMGQVYAAEHTILAKRVAIKLLHREAARSPESLGRFRQEALAASQIGAPQIVEVIDFVTAAPGELEGRTYMVMELLEGESFEDWMDGAHGLDEAMAVLAELCEGLAAAHRAGVIHRDVKPANVFVCARPLGGGEPGERPSVKILDFGVAKVAGGERGFQTQQGSVLGTPYYLAPERVLGAELRPAADVYSVGVMLYELLTGDVPFQGESFVAILAQHVHSAALDPRQAVPGRSIPAPIAELCMALLDKDPARRPGDAAAVAEELRALLDNPQLRAALAGLRTDGHESAVSVDADTHVFGPGELEGGIPLGDRATLPPREAAPMVFARPQGEVEVGGEGEVAEVVGASPGAVGPRRGLTIFLVVVFVALAAGLGGALALVQAEPPPLEPVGAPAAEGIRPETPGPAPSPERTLAPEPTLEPEPESEGAAKVEDGTQAAQGGALGQDSGEAEAPSAAGGAQARTRKPRSGPSKPGKGSKSGKDGASSKAEPEPEPEPTPEPEPAPEPKPSPLVDPFPSSDPDPFPHPILDPFPTPGDSP